MLFIRTVKRILRYSKWYDKIKITAAYHPFDAISQVKQSGPIFDAVLVDYRLEPDNASEDEINGEKLVEILKNYQRCEKSLFYLLSATDKEVNNQIFRLSLDKSGSNLENDLNKIFQELCERIKYPIESEKYTDEKCNFKGNDKSHKLLRYQIDKYLSQGRSLLLCGTIHRDINNLFKDIGQKNFIQIESFKECYIVRDLTVPNCNIENTIEYIEQNKDNYFVIGFGKFDQLEDKIKQKLIERIKTIGVPVILACNDLQKCEILKPLKLICEETDINIPQLYEIFKNEKI